MTEVQKRFKILVDRMIFFDLYMTGDEIDTCLADLETAIYKEKKKKKVVKK